MSTTGEHPIASGPDVSASLEERTSKTLADVRWLLVLVGGTLVTVFGGGWAAFAQVRHEAQEVAQTAAKTETAGIRTEQEAQKHSLAELREEVADTRAEVRELRKDLRRVFPSLPAIARDGGP